MSSQLSEPLLNAATSFEPHLKRNLRVVHYPVDQEVIYAKCSKIPGPGETGPFSEAGEQNAKAAVRS